MSVSSAVTTFNVTLPPAADVEHPRELRIYIDGTLHDVKNLPGHERHVTQLIAPRGSLVRLQLTDDSLSTQRSCPFQAGSERSTVSINDIEVCLLGDLLGSSSCSG
jgi:hypothetical protein